LENSSVSDRFHLEENNFIIDPKKECRFFAERQEVDLQSISNSLRTDIVTDLAPKRLIWGTYGTGKTHTLFAVANILEQLSLRENNEKPSILVVYIEAKILNKNATFLDVYNDFINKIGKQKIEELFSKVYSTIINKYEALQRSHDNIKEFIEKDIPGIYPDLYQIILISKSYNAPLSTIWRWLSGENLSTKLLDYLKIESNLAKRDPTILVEILVSIAKLFDKYENQTLMILLDELDRWDNLNIEAVTSLEMGFMKLCDQNQQNISLILSLSALQFSENESILKFLTLPVIQRIGQHNIINIPDLTEKEAKLLLYKVIEYRRKKDVDFDAIIKMNKTKEKFTIKSYPFSEEALELIVSNTQISLVPRNLLQAMTRSAGQAHIEDSNYITTDYVK